MTLVLRYVGFAVLSIIVNFGAQEAVITLAPHALALSILAGTAAGFAVKYVLDKVWIFNDRYTSGAAEIRKITLYSLFSVFTTLIFWSMEIAFWTVWQTDLAKYGGGLLGLTIGYLAKYALDRRFVFRPETVDAT